MLDRHHKRQQAMKSAILRAVYHDNLSSERQQEMSRRNAVRRAWVKGMGLFVGILSLAGLLGYQVVQETTPPATPEIQEARYVASEWSGGLPPLITEANAGVRPGASFGESGELPGPVDLSNPEWMGATGDYGLLLDQQGTPMADLFGLDVHTIVIDPGHGGEDPGAIGPNGLMEKDITLKIARLLHNRLMDEPGLNVILTRDSDVTLSLKHRVEYAKENDADLLISIHLNTIPDSPLTIVETYYFGPPTDSQSLKVAKTENRHSDYLVADFSKLITQIGNTLKQQESRKLAAHIQSSVYETLRRENRRLIDAGIKTAPFVVLLGAEIPSVLAEVTCISNTDEEARLAKPAYRDKIAAALERGILSYLKQLRRQERRRPDRRNTTYAES